MLRKCHCREVLHDCSTVLFSMLGSPDTGRVSTSESRDDVRIVGKSTIRVGKSNADATTNWSAKVEALFDNFF